MTPSDELFHLIKSLSPSEKRYFKVHASRHVIGKSNHYEKLFDALDALPDDKDYDEAAFKRTLRGKSYGKNLSDEKTHLREILLRAMRVYHAERTPKGRLVEMIHEINFLYSKGFVKNCQQQIEKAIKLATDTEQYTELLVLNDFLVRLYRENPTMAPYTVAEMEQQEQQIIQRISLTREAVYLRMKMTEIQTSQQWQKRETDAKQYFDRATELEKEQHITTRASILLLTARQLYLMHHRLFEQSLDISMEWMKKWMSNAKDMDSLSDNYRLVLANYMMCAMHCERFELLPDAIAKLKSCKASYEKEEADSFRLGVQYELIYLLNSTDFKGADVILKEIEHGLKKYKRFIPAEQSANFRFNVALLYFLTKKYSDCLSQIHSLFNITGREKRYEYITALARTMEWMCQSSTGNDQILDNNLRSLRRYFDERAIEGELMDSMFKLFAQIIKDGNKRSRSQSSIGQKIKTAPHPHEWEQLKAIVLTWF